MKKIVKMIGYSFSVLLLLVIGLISAKLYLNNHTEGFYLVTFEKKSTTTEQKKNIEERKWTFVQFYPTYTLIKAKPSTLHEGAIGFPGFTHVCKVQSWVDRTGAKQMSNPTIDDPECSTIRKEYRKDHPLLSPLLWIFQEGFKNNPRYFFE